jgi:hypothetical protein
MRNVDQTRHTCGLLVRGQRYFNSQIMLCDGFITMIGQVLNRQLDGWLGAVEASDSFTPPIKGCKAIIGP